MSRPLLSLLLSAGLLLAPGLSRAEVEAPREVPRIAQPLVPTAKPSVLVGELKTEHFAISYTPRGEGAARRLAGELEGLRARFAEQLGRDWPGVTSVRVGFGREELEAISVPGGRPPPWAAALAYPDLHLVLLEAGALATEDGTRTVLHELSHAALGQLGGSWPHWFQEGLAMHLSGERVSFRQYTALARAVGADRVVRLSALDRDWPEQLQQVEEAYAESLSFVDFLLGSHGPEAFGSLVDRVAAGERFEGAFASAFGTSLSLEETRWRAQLPLEVRVLVPAPAARLLVGLGVGALRARVRAQPRAGAEAPPGARGGGGRRARRRADPRRRGGRAPRAERARRRR